MPVSKTGKAPSAALIWAAVAVGGRSPVVFRLVEAASPIFKAKLPLVGRRSKNPMEARMARIFG